MQSFLSSVSDDLRSIDTRLCSQSSFLETQQILTYHLVAAHAPSYHSYMHVEGYPNVVSDVIPRTNWG
jgi:hypothetical protein